MERFTESARRVSVVALQEARGLAHTSIGTAHLLLGLIGEGGAAASVLASVGLSLPACRARVRELGGPGDPTPPGHPPFTAGAKRALAEAVRESLALGHRQVVTEHLLLGVLAADRGGALDVLARCGVDPVDLRDRAFAALAGIDLSAPRAARLFLSYRRPQDLHLAGRIADRLDDFGRSVVCDVGECDVLLAVVGPDWAPTELMRAEVARAARRSVPVVPVLVDGAVLPVDQLPVTGHVADHVTVRHETFRADVARLADVVRYAQPGIG
ncbi:ClpA/ClpB-like protein [Saccharothrix saharensis]|uniref:ClpA/ClpB-like protein n=1 Tax=Saccharothrix saharensis TaxID=571190 RepID=A0A543J6Q3_9PSEU|nr:Clp protease N-terminal domain-containing protein [Saccharothrix saharensis]TQM78472.1 ClpA/ClpB-like protein [Saccharothrix saharensis]